MKRLLKNIENSEKNNPQFYEALKEIDALNEKINHAMEIINSKMDRMRINDGPWYTPSNEEILESKIDLLSNILNPGF